MMQIVQKHVVFKYFKFVMPHTGVSDEIGNTLRESRRYRAADEV